MARNGKCGHSVNPNVCRKIIQRHVHTRMCYSSARNYKRQAVQGVREPVNSGWAVVGITTGMGPGGQGEGWGPGEWGLGRCGEVQVNPAAKSTKLYFDHIRLTVV